MAKNPHDPIATYHRKAKALRRIGLEKQCKCGEKRPEALIPGSKPIICVACQRVKCGRTVFDEHHPAGKANNPATIPAHANDHRTVLSSAQYDWPKKTLENPLSSPLLAAAACIRGLSDTIAYLIKELLHWIPIMLETLDEVLAKKLGPKWWVKTKVEQFKPKH